LPPTINHEGRVNVLRQITKKTALGGLPAWDDVVVHVPLEGTRWRLVLRRCDYDTGKDDSVAYADGKFLRICELLIQLAKQKRKARLKSHVEHRVERNIKDAADEADQLRQLTSFIEDASD
jgi:hypothetical protein